MSHFYIYSALSVLLITLLAMNVSRVRMKAQIGNGDGNNRTLRKAIRAHMNSVEHMLPFGLAVLALAQMGQSHVVLGFLVYGFLVTRLTNSFAMLSSMFRIRQITAGLSYLFELSSVIVILLSL